MRRSEETAVDIVVQLPKETSGYRTGAEAFLGLLGRLERLRFFDMGWTSLGKRLWEEREEFLDAHERWNLESDPASQILSIGAVSTKDVESKWSYYHVEYRWGVAIHWLTQVIIDIGYPHPVHGLDISLFVETFDAVIAWKRPQHASMAPPDYRMDLQPLDRQRRGIGWLGWIPFEVSAGDVPEAAVVRPMRWGTFLASQRDWWFAAGPRKDEAAIARAQALDLRLNYLGLLPTLDELRRGDWGQG
jgi:hypothetical protein